MPSRTHLIAPVVLIGVVVSQPMTAQGSAEQTVMLSIGAQDLEGALLAVAREAGREIVFPSDLVAGKRAPSLQGRFTAEQAVQRLLVGSGLVFDLRDGVILIRSASGNEDAGDTATRADVVVTGTSIRGVAPAGSPSLTIDRRAIERSGYATTQQVLQSIPQSYRGGPNEASFGVSQINGSENGEWQGASLNLRGLGAGSTLTLVNGHRVPLGGYGAFADISLIPSSAIERIEVLTDGASAIYGSDAVAGVANVILRRNFTGAESRVRFGTADGNANEVQAGQLLGTHWSSGSLVAAYEYYRRNHLPASRRVFATEDLRSFGGGDFRSGYGTPGTIIAGGRFYGIPTGQDGTRLTPANLIPDQRNRGDSLAGSDLLPTQSRHSFFLSARQEIGAQVELFAEGLFSRRSFDVLPRLDIRERVSVPSTSPFYVDPLGTRAPVTVEYDFAKDLGQLHRTGKSQIVTGTAGLEWRRGDWRMQVFGVYGSQSDDDRVTNYVNRLRVARALADPNPATALNVFGDGSYRNPAATLASIRGSLNVDADYRMASGTLKADGSLFALPGGDVRLALGGEYRHETTRSKLLSDFSGEAPAEQPYLDFRGPRNVAAAFGELFFPLVSGSNRRAGVESLSLSLAGRLEHYNDFGTTANPKAGLTWSPIAGVAFRSSYGTSFRAPPFVNLIQSATARFFIPIPLADPQAPSGRTNVLAVYGNDPDLGPERARTVTAGLDLTPALLPGLKASATYFDIRYRDRIVDPSGNINALLTDRTTFAPLLNTTPAAAQIAAIYAEPRFANPYGIAQGAVQIIADIRVQNLSSVHLKGIDFDLGYSFGSERRRAEIGVDGSYLISVDQAISPTAPAINVVNTIGQPVDLRLRGRASWTTDTLGAAAFFNFTNRYRNTLLASRPRVASYSTVDLQFSYSVPVATGPLNGLRFALSVTNLFDRNPPFVQYTTGASAIGYDPENASAIKRVISLQAIKTW